MSVSEFAVGQRWISNAEVDLGLGIVVSVLNRRVEVSFPAAAEQRVYAIDNAPLGRVIYPVGDRVSTADGLIFVIHTLNDSEGCVVYSGADEQGAGVEFHEIELDSFVRFSKPQDRLFAGQVDKPGRFRLRCETLKYRHGIRRSPAHGLLGARVQLLPHQLYIASQVAKRHAPRVLLADEVGLGKTIEAGLIVHQQLTSGRASRVLIVVPDSLVHQWLVEMLRRFNLRFTLLDEARCQALEQSADNLLDDEFSALTDEISAAEFAEDGVETDLFPEPDQAVVNGDGNVFESAQLVLCGSSLFSENAQRQVHAQAAPWDLLVVDEAHHLEWREDYASPAYSCIEQLAQRIDGLLLLTATPEQLGVEGHFARLRLLDPDRYHDLQKFREEERDYQAVSNLIIALQEAADGEASLDQDYLEEGIGKFLGDSAAATMRQAIHNGGVDLKAAVAETVQNLLDRHGTGRVLFRNTRDAVKGFPQRVLFRHPLPALTGAAGDDIDQALYPEKALGSAWLTKDPRVPWLANWLAENRENKVLVICANATTAQELEAHLRLRKGVRSAVFHEAMDLFARDRAAAYFADEDDAAQTLICSEIGSEGRNFQFAHHLILFDLPLNPDLLEQRIGRLDRIGQKRDVCIHVPYHQDGASAVLVRWYHEALDAFTRVCPVGTAICAAFEARLHAAMLLGPDHPDTTALLSEARQRTDQAMAELQQGRDRLLEMNSCQMPVAEQVIGDIEALGQSKQLMEYLDNAFDQLGVEQHYHSTDTIVVEPTDHMATHALRGLPEDGLTATFSRTRALSREDIQFFTWEHPLVADVMDTIADGDFGSTTLCALKLPPLKPGTLLLEAVFALRCLAPRALQVERYLSQSLVRVVVDERGQDLTAKLSAEHLYQLCKPIKKNVASEMVRHVRAQVGTLVAQAESRVAKQQTSIIAEAQQAAATQLGYELRRLQGLAQVNPNIRAEEVDYMRDAMTAIDDYLAEATLSMDAMRVVLIAP